MTISVPIEAEISRITIAAAAERGSLRSRGSGMRWSALTSGSSR